MTGFIDKDGIYNYNIIIEIPRLICTQFSGHR